MPSARKNRFVLACKRYDCQRKTARNLFQNIKADAETGNYVIESRFQKPNYKEPEENTMLNNRIGNYLTSDFADLPSVGTSNIISTEYDCTAAEKEDNNAAEKE